MVIYFEVLKYINKFFKILIQYVFNVQQKKLYQKI